MMPYMAQGAAQATEDVDTLRVALKAHETIAGALQAYERQRKTRAAYVAKNTRVLQEWLHLHDGPAQEARYEMMRRDTPENPISGLTAKGKIGFLDTMPRNCCKKMSAKYLPYHQCRLSEHHFITAQRA